MARSRLSILVGAALATLSIVIVGSLTGAAGALGFALSEPAPLAAMLLKPFAGFLQLPLPLVGVIIFGAALSFTLASRVDRALRFRGFVPPTVRSGCLAAPG